jgi:hypothetical protein
MDRGFNITWVGGSIYRGYGVQYAMGRGFDILIGPLTLGILNPLSMLY